MDFPSKSLSQAMLFSKNELLILIVTKVCSPFLISLQKILFFPTYVHIYVQFGRRIQGKRKLENGNLPQHNQDKV
jgi:hypothetical protein